MTFKVRTDLCHPRVGDIRECCKGIELIPGENLFPMLKGRLLILELDEWLHFLSLSLS